MVDGLVDLFTDVRDSGESRWVSLEAPSGWGKTRVGREFDCAQIVYANFPQADPTSVELLVNRYRNPWALELVCNMPKYRHKFGELGDLHIGPEEIATIPSGAKELYKKYWEHLPERLRLRYAVAAAITPEAINPQQGQGHRTWSDSVLDEVIDSIDLPQQRRPRGSRRRRPRRLWLGRACRRVPAPMGRNRPASHRHQRRQRQAQ